jgi:hypothetical protein
MLFKYIAAIREKLNPLSIKIPSSPGSSAFPSPVNSPVSSPVRSETPFGKLKQNVSFTIDGTTSPEALEKQLTGFFEKYEGSSKRSHVTYSVIQQCVDMCKEGSRENGHGENNELLTIKILQKFVKGFGKENFKKIDPVGYNELYGGRPRGDSFTGNTSSEDPEFDLLEPESRSSSFGSAEGDGIQKRDERKPRSNSNDGLASFRKRRSITPIPSNEIYPTSFGSISVQDEYGNNEVVELEGSLYCPLDYYPHIDEAAITSVRDAIVTWLSEEVMLIPNTPEYIDKMKKKDFSRFAAHTTLKFKENMQETWKVSFDTISHKHSNLSPLSKINKVLEEFSEPLKHEDLLIATKFFTFLFFHDDWSEAQSNLELVEYLDELVETVFDNPLDSIPIIDRPRLEGLLNFDKTTKFWNEKMSLDSLKGEEDSFGLNELFLEPEAVSEKEYARTAGFFTGLLNAAKDTASDHYTGFLKLNEALLEDVRNDYLGYKDFKAMFLDYVEASEEEVSNRLDEIVPDEEKFNKKRVKTSAVEAVYVSSVLTAGIPIPRSVRTGHRMNEIEDNLGKLICRFNSFISAYKEANTLNWVSNDLFIIHADKERSSCGNEFTYADSFRHLESRIFVDMKDSKRVLNSMKKSRLEEYMYAGLVVHWGVGSLPAQMVSGRYSSGTRGAYIPEDRVLELHEKNGFWKFLQKDAPM